MYRKTHDDFAREWDAVALFVRASYQQRISRMTDAEFGEVEL